MLHHAGIWFWALRFAVVSSCNILGLSLVLVRFTQLLSQRNHRIVAFALLLKIFHNETTVNPILGQIPAGPKYLPARNFTGHLFGHDLFGVIPRLQIDQKSLKMMRRRRNRKHDRSVFLPFSDFSRGKFRPYFLTKPPQQQISPNTAKISV